ncbi:MAG: hypothetical protein KF795_00580 [Labilithrix sp.]|nr:hypothetical protein [Labilithrix sp.]
MSERRPRDPSLLRSAHGTNRDALLVVERPPLDEIEPPNAERTESALASKAARGRPFEPGNAAAKGRRPKLARMPDSAATAHPRWQRYERQARRYVTRRCRELAVETGVASLGAGPSAMLAAAGLARAASLALYEVASETLDGRTFAEAAALGDKARQSELTAVALAEREAKARPRDDGSDSIRARLEHLRAGAPTTA